MKKTIFAQLILLLLIFAISEMPVYDWISPTIIGEVRIARIGDKFGLVNENGYAVSDMIYSDIISYDESVIFGYQYNGDIMYDNSKSITVFDEFGNILHQTSNNGDYSGYSYVDYKSGEVIIQIANQHTREVYYLKLSNGKAERIKGLTTDHYVENTVGNYRDKSIKLGTTESLFELANYLCDLLDWTLVIYPDESDVLYDYLDNTIQYALVYNDDQFIGIDNSVCYILPIAKDALVFFNNTTNMLTNLSTQEIIDVYSAYKKDYSINKVNVMAFQCKPNSDAQREFYRTFDIPMIAQQKTVHPWVSHNGMQAVDWDGVNIWDIEYINFENALGYTLLHTFYTKDTDGIKLVSIDSVFPSVNNIIDNNYPYTKTVIILNKDDSVPNTLTMAIKTAEYDRFLSENGYIAIN